MNTSQVAIQHKFLSHEHKNEQSNRNAAR